MPAIQSHLIASPGALLGFAAQQQQQQHVKHPNFFGAQPYQLVAGPPTNLDYRCSFTPPVALRPLEHHHHNGGGYAGALSHQQLVQNQQQQQQLGVVGRDLVWGAALHRPPFPFPLVHPVEQRLPTSGWIGGGGGGFGVPFRQFP